MSMSPRLCFRLPSDGPAPAAPVPAAPVPAAALLGKRSSRPEHPWPGPGGALSALGILLVGLAGCGGLEPVTTHESETDPTQLYMALTLEYHAINLATEAPYHTIQLVATPRDGRDSAMSGLPAPHFYLRFPDDTSKLQVTPEGLVTARAAGEKIPVIAELLAPGPVRHADTALVTVTSGPPPVLDRLSIEPTSPASAIWPMGSHSSFFAGSLGLVTPPVLTPQPLDATGQPIAGLVVEFASLNPERAELMNLVSEGGRWTGRVIPRRPGTVRMVARTIAYGVVKADTALFTVTWPMEAEFRIAPGPSGTGIFEPPEVRVIPNALVVWISHMADPADSVDVTFDDPAGAGPLPLPFCGLPGSPPALCGSGDLLIPGTNPEGTNGGFRWFATPGVYTYRSIRTGATGRIIVTDELPPGVAEP